MSDLTCRLCLGQYQPDENISQLPCGHRFHTECLEHVESVQSLRDYIVGLMGYPRPEYPKPCPCCRAQFSADDLTNVDYNEINSQDNMQLVLSSAQNTSDATLTVFNPTLERSMQQMTLTRNGIGPFSNALETSSSAAALVAFSAPLGTSSFNPNLEESMQQMTLIGNGIDPVSNALETSSFNPNLEESMQQMTLTRTGIDPVSNALETSSSIIASDVPTELILRRTRESISARRGKGTTGHKPKTEVIRKGPATTGGKKKTEVIRKGPATTGGKKKTEVIR